MEDSEECSSSESGWTMYLASPMHEVDDDDEGDGEVEDGGGGDDDNRGRSNKDDGDGNDDDDDDSMASDASSGPAASYVGHGQGSKVVERENHKVEAKEEEMRKTKSSKKNQDKGGGATSKVGRTKANK